MPKILIVDDEQEIVTLLTTRMTHAGHECFWAHDGRGALEAVSKNRPDLILLDVMMPPPNGYQVCRELKQNAATRDIPVVLLTAKGSESDKFWGRESGADAYITKPFDSTALLTKIKELL